MVDQLLARGADGRSANSRQQTALYVAIHYGHEMVVRRLLTAFPDLVQTVTVEQWSALHAACINGNVDVARLLIEWSYPELAVRTFQMDGGSYECRLPFDPNVRDITGQTPLYVACLLGNTALVKLLLDWRVPFERVAADSNAVEEGMLVRNANMSATLQIVHIPNNFRRTDAELLAQRVGQRLGHHNTIETRRFARHPIDHGASLPRP